MTSHHHNTQNPELLSDRELSRRLMTLAANEREVTLAVLVALGEVDRRKLYARGGYRSLYDFCVRRLRYSEATAARRVAAARCVRDYTELRGMLREGSVNPCTVSRIAPIMTNENARELMSEIRGRSLREVEVIVARHRPGRRYRDRISPVYVQRVVPERGEQSGGDRASGRSIGDVREPGDGQKRTISADGKNLTTCEEGAAVIGGGGTAGEPVNSTNMILEKRFKLSFTVNPAFLDKAEKARALLSNSHAGELSFERLFELMLDEYLDRYSPESRMRRRKKREKTKRERAARAGESGEAEEIHEPKRRDKRLQKNKKRSRDISRAVRDAVFIRDKGRCTYVGPDGTRCGAKKNLQIDHIVPYARGGDNSPENLRLLCARHNRLEADREYGEDHMKKFHRRE
jgi:5-methylcytosine-specific restriction endonuclease McrA